MPEKFDNTKYPRITFRVGNTILKNLEHYAGSEISPDAMAKFLLEACLSTLPRSLPTFSLPEALFICSMLNDSTIRPDTLHYLRQDLIDALLAESKRNFDPIPLKGKLESLTPFEWVAVVIAVQQYWKGKSYKDVEESAKRLCEVGLVKY